METYKNKGWVKIANDVLKQSISIQDNHLNLMEEIKKYQWDDSVINAGTGKPDQKNSISEDTYQDKKTMCKDVAKDIRTEGERERKNTSNDDRFEC